MNEATRSLHLLGEALTPGIATLREHRCPAAALQIVALQRRPDGLPPSGLVLAMLSLWHGQAPAPSELIHTLTQAIY